MYNGSSYPLPAARVLYFLIRFLLIRFIWHLVRLDWLLVIHALTAVAHSISISPLIVMLIGMC
jgi:hypothetical protein